MNVPRIFAPPSPSFASRRDFLKRAGNGLGLVALSTLLGEKLLRPSIASAAGAVNPLAPRAVHFPAKARSVIWLFMNGGPSQVDTWDYKPELQKRDGQELAGF